MEDGSDEEWGSAPAKKAPAPAKKKPAPPAVIVAKPTSASALPAAKPPVPKQAKPAPKAETKKDDVMDDDISSLADRLAGLTLLLLS